MIFSALKNGIWDKALEETESSRDEASFDLELSRFRAAKHATKGLPDDEGRYTCFSQAFRQMHNKPPQLLRKSVRLYRTILAGEKAIDAGGPYRESFGMYCQELQSPVLSLLLPTPNGRHSIGQNRDQWVLNPGARSSLLREMFVFLGRLMGVAIRGKEYLTLSLPPIIWKSIVGENLTREDLEAVDQFLVISLDKLRDIDKEGIDASNFNDVFFETFTTVSTDNRVVELIPNGAAVPVLYDNRTEYCDLVIEYRLREFEEQVKAVREGLRMIVPFQLVSLYSWDQFERMVCGVPMVDIGLLRSVTEYSSCSSSDQHISFFWRCLEDFSLEERQAFLRFTWGRSRLPMNAASFSQNFKIQSFQKSPADSYFPLAHTCFFSIELPAYSSLEIMKAKLHYAIFNCQAIDGDDTNVAMAVDDLDWDDSPI